MTRLPLPRHDPDDRASALARLVVHHERRAAELRDRADAEPNMFRARGFLEMADAFEASARSHRQTLRAVVRSEAAA